MAKIDVSAMTTLSNRVSEAFKSLRANIEFCGKDQRVIAITAARRMRERAAYP